MCAKDQTRSFIHSAAKIVVFIWNDLATRIRRGGLGYFDLDFDLASAFYVLGFPFLLFLCGLYVLLLFRV
jgi:hypothetical protein